MTEEKARKSCPVSGGNGSGFGGCVNKNCNAGRCIALRKGARL